MIAGFRVAAEAAGAHQYEVFDSRATITDNGGSGLPILTGRAERPDTMVAGSTAADHAHELEVFRMGGFSPIHWLVIGLVALLLFGNRLPEVARSIGRAFKEFKRGLSDISDEMDKTDEEPRRRDELHAPPSDRRVPHDDSAEQGQKREQYHDEPADRQD